MLFFLNLAFVHWKGLALAGNKVDYHVFAVIDLCLLFSFQPTTGSSVVSEEGTVAQQRVRFFAGRRPAMLNASLSALLVPRMAARDSKTQIFICFSIAARYVWFIAG